LPAQLSALRFGNAHVGLLPGFGERGGIGMATDMVSFSFVRRLGAVFILFAIAFNLPYAWLGANFSYPDILRRPPGEILTAFAAGGAPLILAWAGFALAALLLAPVAVGMAAATRRAGNGASAIAGLGVAAGLAQAIGLCRWVYAVPGLAAAWTSADAAGKAAVETTFTMLHQFAGVGIGEAIGQSLTAFWLIGVAVSQRRHPRFGGPVAAFGLLGGIVLLPGVVEGLATVLAFEPGIFGLSALVGYLMLTVWLIWTGVLCILRPAAG
jgi:hypothetical protein